MCTLDELYRSSQEQLEWRASLEYVTGVCTIALQCRLTEDLVSQRPRAIVRSTTTCNAGEKYTRLAHSGRSVLMRTRSLLRYK